MNAENNPTPETPTPELDNILTQVFNEPPQFVRAGEQTVRCTRCAAVLAANFPAQGVVHDCA